MLNVKENKSTNSHVLTILGLSIGFDDVDWSQDGLILLFRDNAVACLEGEILSAFQANTYVKDNLIGS